jgi:stage III sporulation protein AA
MTMTGYQAAARLLPGPLYQRALAVSGGEQETCEELRLRVGRPMTGLWAGQEVCLGQRAVSALDVQGVLEAATGSSLHAAASQLCRGFVAAPGGVRVGVCGTAVCPEGIFSGLRSFSSVCLRIPKAVPDCADGVWPSLVGGGLASTLIVSPPGGGKTTLLRELVRRASDGLGLRVSVADERGEIADGFFGVPGFDVGCHTDVLTGVPKARAVHMLLRGMNPQVLVLDEVTEPDDAQALLTAVGCGVVLLATVHGQDLRDAARRPVCQRLLAEGVFRRCVQVRLQEGKRVYTVEELT